MFVDLPAAPRGLAHLWDVSVGERVGAMMDGRTKVAFVYRSPDTSTFRYRVANLVEAINSDPDPAVRAGWFSEEDLRSIWHLIPQLDVIVVTRFPYGAALHDLITRAQRSGVRLVFDCDDLVFDVRYAATVMDSLGRDPDVSAEWDVWYAYMGRLHTSMSACSGALTTNTTLRRRLTDHFDEADIRVVPNVLNREQQEFSLRLLEAKQASGWRRTGPVMIGYFSGTPSHVRDFAIAAPSLARLLAEDPGVSLRVVGFLDDLGDLEEFEERIEFLPFMHYVDLQRAIAQVEVNIAPLQHNVFNNCKSDLKYFEAAVVGTWTVASHTPSLDAAIDDGETGRLARAHEWDDALREAVALARDTAAYAQRCDLAAAKAHSRWAWDAVRIPARQALTSSR